MEQPTFHELLSRLALNAIDVQRLWDNAFARDFDAFRFPGPVEPWMVGFFSGLTPSRLAVGTFVLETSLLLSASRTEGFVLKALPLNFQYSTRFGADFEKCSRIVVTVEQCPVRSRKSQNS
jgi:hypothetical protein